MKHFYLQSGIGTAKYLVNFHDGIKTNRDGSLFYDLRIFKNKKRLAAFVKELTAAGYVEGR